MHVCDLEGLKFLCIAMSELARTKRDEVRGSGRVGSRRDQGLSTVRIRDVVCVCTMDHAQQ